MDVQAAIAFCVAFGAAFGVSFVLVRSMERYRNSREKSMIDTPIMITAIICVTLIIIAYINRINR